jgi:hypothetical protein
MTPIEQIDKLEKKINFYKNRETRIKNYFYSPIPMEKIMDVEESQEKRDGAQLGWEESMTEVTGILEEK